jgi:hypothetical protein
MSGAMFKACGSRGHYNHGITRVEPTFSLDDRRLPYLELSFEDLMVRTGSDARTMNGFFGLGLSIGDLYSVCNMPLGRKSRNWKALLRATLIYVKNYAERDGTRAGSASAAKHTSSRTSMTFATSDLCESVANNRTLEVAVVSTQRHPGGICTGRRSMSTRNPMHGSWARSRA